jgi:hypothetical protein
MREALLSIGESKRNSIGNLLAGDVHGSVAPLFGLAAIVLTCLIGLSVDLFPGLVHFSNLVFGVADNSAATPADKKIEVSLMIDLIGSMGETRNGVTKIAGLQAATIDLMDILFPNGATTSSTVRVAIAPAADYVNAGTGAAAVTGLPDRGFYSLGSDLSGAPQGVYHGSHSGVDGVTQGQSATSSSSPEASATDSSGFCTHTNAAETQTFYVQGISGAQTLPVGTPVGFSKGSSAVSGSYYYSSQTWNGYQQWYVCWSGAPYYMDCSYAPIATADPNCSTAQNQPNGRLISCVTGRTGTHAYDDASPSTSPVGAYNQGSRSGVSNYSSDGQCYVAGRVLPPVIPLTNNKNTILNFVSTVTVGGGRPGPIGTARAWYLISPNWASVLPTSSAPASYSDTTTMKVAILTTDGEHNEQYTNVDSRSQALSLCTNMKGAGITVCTVGLGFDASAVSTSSDGMAMDLLKKCASSSSAYFFPNDGRALRQAFQNIGNQLMYASLGGHAPRAF